MSNYDKSRPVKLVSYTKMDPEYAANEMNQGDINLQELIAYCARVSNPENQNNTKTSGKLIQYLIDHKHWSPFEMVNVVLELNTTRDIAHQIVRHRSFAFQEFSQRYADPTKMQFVTREARLQDHKNRQNSLSTNDTFLRVRWHEKQEYVNHITKEAYEWAIAHGIAKEQARSVLPEGNTPTRLFMNGTIRSWIHWIEIRSDVATQLEHRVLAIAAAHEIEKVFPLILNFKYNEETKVSDWLGL